MIQNNTVRIVKCQNITSSIATNTANIKVLQLILKNAKVLQ